MSAAVTTIHIVLAALLVFPMLAIVWHPAHPRLRALARASGAVALVVLATGASRIRAWEPSTRRAVYFVSRDAGLWLDRKIVFGVAACTLALALAALSFVREPSPRVVRVLAIASLVLALAAWFAVVFVHARAPAAAVEYVS